MSKNDLFTNLERSLFTFNLSHINEICFNKIYPNGVQTATKEADLIKFDNCVDKYIAAFKEVREVTKDKIFNEE